MGPSASDGLRGNGLDPAPEDEELQQLHAEVSCEAEVFSRFSPDQCRVQTTGVCCPGGERVREGAIVPRDGARLPQRAAAKPAVAMPPARRLRKCRYVSNPLAARMSPCAKPLPEDAVL